MRRKFAAIVLAVTIATTNGSACAMNSPSAKPAACRVIGGDKLPPSSGGAEALCAAIERAAGTAFSVEVRILSSSSLVAAVRTADGRSLPEQRLDVMDSALTKNTFERFAQNLAAEVARSLR